LKQSKKISEGAELLIATLLAIGCSVLFCLVIKSKFLPSVIRYEKIFFWAGEIILAAFYFFAVGAIACNAERLKKIIITVYIFFLFCLILLYLLICFGFFSVITSIDELRAFILRAGKWTWFVFIALQFLQVVLLPVPGFVSTTVGIALFGAPLCFLLSFIGIESGSLAAFIIGRRLGYRAVSWMAGRENLDGWIKKMKGKDAFLLSIALLFPFFPDDILCFVAGLSSMKFSFFVIISSVTRGIAIAANCFSVNFIPFSTWWGLLIWAALLALVVAAFILIYKNMEKIRTKLEAFNRKLKKK